MKKTGFFILLLLLLFGGCEEREAETIKQYAYTTKDGFDEIVFQDVTVRIASGYLTEEERNRIAGRLESAVQEADRFLKEKPGWDSAANPVICELRSGPGATAVSGNTVTVYYAENGGVPYISLLTQAKAGLAGVPDWLREGVGAYAADLGQESMMDTMARRIPAFDALKKEKEPKYHSIDELASTLVSGDQYPEALTLGDLSEAVLSAPDEAEAYNLRGAYCVYAGSFVHYLDTAYGREALWRLYQGENMETVTGQTKEEALAAWQETLR